VPALPRHPKAGRDNLAGRIDDFVRLFRHVTDFGDAAADHTDIGVECGQARPVDDAAVTNDEIQHDQLLWGGFRLYRQMI
jgi:hypothetical protein